MSIISDLFAGGISGVLDSFSKTAQVFHADSTKQAEYDAAFEKLRADLLTLGMQVEARTIESVNATMQAEGKSEHWMQWSWRPMNGFVLAFGSFAAVLFTLYAAYMTITGAHPEALSAIPAIVNAIAMVLAIPGAVCGVTAWYRGQTQLESSKK